MFFLPKKLKKGESSIVHNCDAAPPELDRATYFIDLPVEGHILGIMWVCSIGFLIDNQQADRENYLYEHLYGNRLRKFLINPDTNDVTYSPYLFEPYFSQYESWRDKALKLAQRHLDDKQDVLILTLDFKDFFYSLDMTPDAFEELANTFKLEDGSWQHRLHWFVYEVMSRYSDILREVNFDPKLDLGDRTVLPIGFLPSNIFSNWVLSPFDDTIVNQLNPLYYGRYVDDIIIVDKSKNSDFAQWAKYPKDPQKILSREKVMQYYFCRDSEEPILIKMDALRETSNCKNTINPKERDRTYRLNPNLLEKTQMGGTPVIELQNKKVKMFYFHSGASATLLDKFRRHIAENASEFRFLPMMKDLLAYDDISEILELKRTGSIHKLSGIEGFEINKYLLSKFLGKYRKMVTLVKVGAENRLQEEILKLFDKRTLVEHHSLWERLLEITMLGDSLENYEKLVNNILAAIEALVIPQQELNNEVFDPKAGLKRELCAAINRTAALRLGKKAYKLYEKIGNKLLHLKGYNPGHNLNSMRHKYLETSMVNKYILPLPIECIELDLLEASEVKKEDIRLWELREMQKFISPSWESNEYNYYPYMVTPQDLSFAMFYCSLCQKGSIPNPKQQEEKLDKMYREWNYPNLRGKEDDFLKYIKAGELSTNNGESKDYFIIVNNDSDKRCRQLKVEWAILR